MRNNIYLVGFSGVGKSTVGALLAAKLHLTFVDLDLCIETRRASRIADIFAEEGEDAFRAYERAALSDVAKRVGQVVATGAGVVLDMENWKSMQASGSTVFLDSSFEEIYARLTEMDVCTRPLFRGKSKEQLKALYAARKAYYTSADFSIGGDGKSAASIAEELAEKLRGHL